MKHKYFTKKYIRGVKGIEVIHVARVIGTNSKYWKCKEFPSDAKAREWANTVEVE